jgi:hypothetical protein
MSTSSHPRKITITALKADNRGQPYSVSFEGQTIIAKSHVPSHDACRHLVSLGLTGPLEVWAAGEPFPRLRIRDIEKAAKRTVSEGASTSVHFTNYRPFDRTRFQREMQEPVWHDD